MTTVAWDGKILAADSRISCDTTIITDSGRKLYSLPRVHYRNDKLLAIAMSGIVSDYDRIIDAIMAEDIGNGTKIEHECAAIVVGEKFVYELDNGADYLIRYDRHIKLAHGSGSKFALAAMYLKKNARQAVTVAMALDHATGGLIHSFILKGD